MKWEGGLEYGEGQDGEAWRWRGLDGLGLLWESWEAGGLRAQEVNF